LQQNIFSPMENGLEEIPAELVRQARLHDGAPDGCPTWHNRN
jgi:hypothetical protein